MAHPRVIPVNVVVYAMRLVTGPELPWELSFAIEGDNPTGGQEKISVGNVSVF